MTNTEKDAELKLLAAAREVAVDAELLVASGKYLGNVSSDCARNARKDVAEAIESLQEFHELLTRKVDGR